MTPLTALRAAPLVFLAAPQAPAQGPNEALFLSAPASAAKQCAERALALEKGDAESNLLLGRALGALGDRNGAQVAFRTARKAASTDPELLAGLGRAYLRLGDRVAAQEALDAAEACRPRSATPCRFAAQVWREVGELEAVRPLAAKVLQLAPKDAENAAEFAVDLLDMGLGREAAEIMKALFPHAPKAWESFTNFGAACLRAKLPADAATWYQRGLTARPREERARRAMLEGYVEYGTPEDCRSQRAALLEAFEFGWSPKDRGPEALVLLGRLHLRLGERDTAEGCFRDAIMHKEAGAEAYQLIGRAWMKAGFEAEALRAYEVVISGKGTGSFMGLSPGGLWGIDFAKINRKQALMNAALELAHLGHKAKALPLADEAYLLDPEDFDNMVAMGKACLRKGWIPEAARFLVLGGKKAFKDRDYWTGVGNALLDTLPPPGKG
jgi:tetratricopeptide (TPR) repeat protein